MAIRVLRRKVIIREYDFNKIQNDVLGLHYDGKSLYDRIDFTPLDKDTLEKLKLQEILKGKSGPLTEANWTMGIPAVLLYQLKDYLYDSRYYNWNPSIDEEGYICVQARKNTPKTRLGWGVFEKDLTCRL